MKSNPKITEIRFTKMRQEGSHVGFISFLYDGRIALKEIAVHELREPKNGLRYRLVYPINKVDKVLFHPIDKKTQEHIDYEINTFLQANETVATKQEVKHDVPMGDKQPL